MTWRSPASCSSSIRACRSSDEPIHLNWRPPTESEARVNESQLAVVKQMYDEWGGGQDGNGEHLHPDYTLVFARGFLDEGVHAGWSEAWKGWRSWLEQWESWRYDPVEFLDLGA